MPGSDAVPAVWQHCTGAVEHELAGSVPPELPGVGVAAARMAKAAKVAVSLVNMMFVVVLEQMRWAVFE